MAMPLRVINSCKGHALCHVSMRSHVWHTIQRYKTPGTGTATKVPDAGQKYSMTGVSVSESGFGGLHLLLLVVCRICEYTRVKTMPDTVITLNCHSVLVCIQEFTIQDNRPLAVVHFLMAMCHKGGIRSLPTNVCC
jgi:hypothetical protein